jgi:hypothetical protein
VAWSSYYFPTVRGRGERVRRPQDDSAKVAAVLRDLFDVLATGTYLHANDKGDCRFCAFQRACGTDPATRAQQKLKNAANGALDAYRRLRDHA